MRHLFHFNRKRWKAFGTIIGGVYCLAILGVWVAIYIPFIGGPFFLAGLMLWYIPGIVFQWTGFFEYHQFGAAPTDWIGHVIMFLFYAAIAFVVSWPFGREKKKQPVKP